MALMKETQNCQKGAENKMNNQLQKPSSGLIEGEDGKLKNDNRMQIQLQQAHHSSTRAGTTWCLQAAGVGEFGSLGLCRGDGRGAILMDS